MVTVITVRHPLQPRSDNRHWLVHLPAQLLLNGMEFRPHPLGHCAPPDHKVAFRVPATIVGEPEERECFRFSFAALPTIGRCKASESDQPCLLRMNLQPKLRQPLPKVSQEPLGISLMLETGHEIISVANDNHVPSRHFLAPFLGPQIEDIVQIHVSRQR